MKVDRSKLKKTPTEAVSMHNYSCVIIFIIIVICGLGVKKSDCRLYWGYDWRFKEGSVIAVNTCQTCACLYLTNVIDFAISP